MKDGSGNTAQDHRLHRTATASAEHDYLGAKVTRHGKDVGGDLVPAIDDSWLSDESSGRRSPRAVAGGVERRLLESSVSTPVVSVGASPEADPQRAVAGHRLQESLPNHEHRRVATGHQLRRAVNRRLRVR